MRKRQLTDELVQIRTQKAEVLRQIQAIAKRQKTGGMPTQAAELLASNNKLVLQMEQRNRAEKVRRTHASPASCCRVARAWCAMCATRVQRSGSVAAAAAGSCGGRQRGAPRCGRARELLQAGGWLHSWTWTAAQL